MINDKCSMTNDKCSGFTLLELLVVLIIIGFLVTAIGRTFRKVDKDAQYVAALSDMKAIADAIVKGIYPDLGYIPCTGEDPVSAITCLCLDLKRCMEEIQEYTYQNTNPYSGEICQCIEYQDLTPECRELLFLLAGQRSNDKECGENGILKSKFIKNIWNKYYSKGYRGPYIECNATYYYNPEASEEGYYLPAIATPWADKCEKMAREAEKNGDDDLAKEYRKGKYYQILQPIKSCTTWSVRGGNYQCASYGYVIPKNMACIVCNGPDCLPSDMQAYLQDCANHCPDLDCEEFCRQECDIECGSIVDYSRKQKCYEKCLPERYKKCINNDPCFSECASKLKDQDIGDDIVMFVFSGVVRSPLEK